jgi:hypothetical protein
LQALGAVAAPLQEKGGAEDLHGEEKCHITFLLPIVT